MKIFKPESLAVLYRGFRFAGRSRLSLGLMACFELDEGRKPALLTEADLWKRATKALGSGAILDEGFPKPTGEFLVFGAAHASANTQATEVAVTAQVGPLQKTLLVRGDRHFNALGLASPPQPFSAMPITPATAFGGATFAENPLGKGALKIKAADGSSLQPLPNVESAGKFILAPGDVAPPAGFWAYGPGAPERTRHLGNFDEPWLKTTWPHLPDTTSPAYFQTAPRDQRLGGFFRGDEPIRLGSMHPVRPSMAACLPGLRARCFINRSVDGGAEFSEIEARPETVWLFPGLECGILLFRAVADVTHEDADDVLHVMADWELMSDEPLGFSHYHEEFLRQLPIAAQTATAVGAPAEAAAGAAPAVVPGAAAASVGASVPALASASVPDHAAFLAQNPELQEVHRLAAELEKSNTELMQKHGLTAADLAPFLKEDIEPAAGSLADVERMAAEVQAQSRELMAKYKLTDADLAPYMPKPEVESANPVGDLEKALLDVQAINRETMQKTGLTQADLDAVMVANPELAEMVHQPVPEVQAAMAGLAALTPAAAMPKPGLPKPELPALKVPELASVRIPVPQKLTREDVVARHALKQGFAAFDLSGLDLSGLDLLGADFSLAVLEKTSFKGSRLSGAAFRDALMTGSDFSDADLSGAMLTGVSAGSALFAKARLDGSNASKADFTGADFSAAQLVNSNISGAIFDGSKMAGIKAANCNAQKTSFADCDLGAADFTDARLTAAAFTSAKLAKANFVNTACDNAEFYGADATQANFTNANLKASRADATSQFAEAQFGRSHLGRAAWEGVQLGKANLEGAVLDDADFSRAQAADARFGRASAKGTKFDKADISRADFSGVNLFKGSMRHTKTDATLLRKANLYGVDFYGTSPTIASLEGSNIDQTLLVIRKPVV